MCIYVQYTYMYVITISKKRRPWFQGEWSWEYGRKKENGEISYNLKNKIPSIKKLESKIENPSDCV